jgi:GT2 family glycosyltransferase
MKKIAAGIVTFNPDKKRFRDCLSSILEQVEVVYVVDNSDTPCLINNIEGVKYVHLKNNLGIAFALNKIMSMAEEDNFEWVVTLDQDSIIPSELIKKYEVLINNDEEYPNMGIVCPQVLDRRRHYMVEKKNPEVEYVSECITSGSCTSINVWRDIGKFDSWLFIDLVDNEFCKRVIAAGYTIVRLNNCILDQEFGKIHEKSNSKIKFWLTLSKILHNKNIAKMSYKKYVSPLRVYYTNRNIIYVNRKMKNYGKVGYNNYNCKGYFGFLLFFSLASLFRAQDKRKVLSSILNGAHDGRRKKVNHWEYTGVNK